MSFLICSGTLLTCSFGLAPSILNVFPAKRVFHGSSPAACITDNIPMINIMPFGMCTTMTNPAVASATAAKLGVYTPAACVPAPLAPWSPGSPRIMIGSIPVLNNTSKLACAWGGIIKICPPAKTNVILP